MKTAADDVVVLAARAEALEQEIDVCLKRLDELTGELDAIVRALASVDDRFRLDDEAFTVHQRPFTEAKHRWHTGERSTRASESHGGVRSLGPGSGPARSEAQDPIPAGLRRGRSSVRQSSGQHGKDRLLHARKQRQARSIGAA
jgi:hypothetical protein